MEARRRAAPLVCLALALASGALVLAGCGVTDPIPPGPAVALELVATFPAASGNPVQLVGVPDGSGRDLVLGQAGRVHVLAGGVLDATPILDMAARGLDLTGDPEGGALELVFHPNFAGIDGPAGRGLFYTYTAEEPDGAPDFDHPELAAVVGNGQTVLREWQMGPAEEGGAGFDVVLPGSRVLMRIDQPQVNHNGGGMDFDADGLLYVGIGDGGGGNDYGGFPSNPSDGHTDVGGNGQDRTNVYGTVLRIDPLGSDSANGQYGIPDNPFTDDENGWLDEIWAWGLRNPYGVHVAADGTVWIADVGQSAREEIDRAEAGDNFGWPHLEGTLPNPDHPSGPADTVPPVGEYTHDEGVAVLGGFVYAGPAIPALHGVYLFGDFLKAGLGQLFAMDTTTGAISELVLLPGSATVSGVLFGVGRDHMGEIHYLLRPFAPGSLGSIMRVGAAPGDRDGDGVGDGSDLCPGHPDAAQGDADGDAVGDACDVCTLAADPAQRDRDLDGAGDACDCDFDGNGFCTVADFSLFLPDLLAGVESTPGTDMSGDGAVNVGDFSLFLPGLLRGTPGPPTP